MPVRRNLSWCVPVLPAMLAMSGCTTNAELLLQLESLESLEPGATTREFVLERYGEPTDAYDSDRLLVYVLSSKGVITDELPHPSDADNHDIVFEFDESDTLLRYTVVAPQ